MEAAKDFAAELSSSTRFSSAHTTNRHSQAYKFLKIQIRFRFWSPLRDLFSYPLQSRTLVWVATHTMGTIGSNA